MTAKLQGGALVMRASSSLPIDRLYLKVRTLKGGVVQLIDPKAVVSREHVLGAYLDAKRAFAGHTNIANSMAVEMLLFTAMTKQISDAIKAAGAKSGSDFVLFCSSNAAYLKVKPFLSSHAEFRPSRASALAAVKRLGIRDTSTEAVLQGMALSRLEG